MFHCWRFYLTFGTKVKIRKKVARTMIPPEIRDVLISIWPLRMNVMSTITTSTILEMYIMVVTDFESLRTVILTLRV